MQREDVERLEKLIKTLEDSAINAERMCELLQPEFDAFEARTGHNVYVVRDYVDHMNAAKRQRLEASSIRTLLAERDALRAAIFGGTDYATDLTNGNFVEMAQTTEAARIGALARAEKAEAERDALQGQLNDLRNGWAKSVKAHAALLAERDAAFAAGQRDMQERAIQDVAEWGCLFLGSGENVTVDVIDDLRDLPIKPRP